jgi:hypothetical protein
MAGSATRGSSQNPVARRADASLSGGDGSGTGAGAPKAVGIPRPARDRHGGGFDADGATSRPGSFLFGATATQNSNARDLQAVRAVASAVAAAVQAMAMPGDARARYPSQSGQPSTLAGGVSGGPSNKSAGVSSPQLPALPLSTVPEHRSDTTQLSASFSTAAGLSQATASRTDAVATTSSPSGNTDAVELVPAADASRDSTISEPSALGAQPLNSNYAGSSHLLGRHPGADKPDSGPIGDDSIQAGGPSSNRPTPRLLTRPMGAAMISSDSLQSAAGMQQPQAPGSHSGVRLPVRTGSKIVAGTQPDGLPPAVSGRTQAGSSDWPGGAFSVAQAQAGPRLQALLKQVMGGGNPEEAEGASRTKSNYQLELLLQQAPAPKSGAPDALLSGSSA